MNKVRKLVTKRGLRDTYGIPYCFAHIARLEKLGMFPKRVRLSANRVCWWTDEVEDWMESRPRG